MRRAAIFLRSVTVTLVSHSSLGRGIVSKLALESVSLNEMHRLIRLYLTAQATLSLLSYSGSVLNVTTDTCTL